MEEIQTHRNRVEWCLLGPVGGENGMGIGNKGPAYFILQPHGKSDGVPNRAAFWVTKFDFAEEITFWTTEDLNRPPDTEEHKRKCGNSQQDQEEVELIWLRARTRLNQDDQKIECGNEQGAEKK